MPTDLPGNRRERKKQETRAALEQAALRLFAVKGYEHTTVEEIAEAADVAVRTFFRYFSSKQHVLFGDVAHQRVNRMCAALAASPSDEPPLEAVRAVLEALDLDQDEQGQLNLRLRLLKQQPSLVGTYLMLNHELRQALVHVRRRATGLPSATRTRCWSPGRPSPPGTSRYRRGWRATPSARWPSCAGRRSPRSPPNPGGATPPGRAAGDRRSGVGPPAQALPARVGPDRRRQPARRRVAR